MIIDTQTHYVPPRARAILDAWPGVRPAGLPPDSGDTHTIFSLDARLREMDRCGVDVSVLSFAPIGPSGDAKLDCDLAKAANDGLIGACDLHPQRFVALARVPLPYVDMSLGEAHRVASAAAIRGVSLLAESVGYCPDRSNLDPLWMRAAQRQWAVVLHPPAGVADLSPLFTDFGLNSAFHAMVGSTLTLARLIFSGILDRHPQLDVIATHLGGVAPFLAERFDSRGKGALHPFSDYLRTRVYFDNCGFSAATLRFVLEAVGAQRIVLGSDWPSRSIDECLATLLDLSVEARDLIAGVNAARWFAV